MLAINAFRLTWVKLQMIVDFFLGGERKMVVGDRELEKLILEELDFEPRVHLTDLVIVVDGGVATITGHLSSLEDKAVVSAIVESVRGVRAIAEEIEIWPITAHTLSDVEIARRVAKILNWNTKVPKDRIVTTVRRGWVTLRGDVFWRYQSRAAEEAVRQLVGVRGISNQLKVVPAAYPKNIDARLRSALNRNAEVDAAAIRITVDGSVVRLEGEVHYLTQRSSVERVAWNAPGVTNVIDEILVV